MYFICCRIPTDQTHYHIVSRHNPSYCTFQVQEPKLSGGENSEKEEGGDDNLEFRPHINEVVDSQIQPQAGIDDSQRQEQMHIPIVNQAHVRSHWLLYSHLHLLCCIQQVFCNLGWQDCLILLGRKNSLCPSIVQFLIFDWPIFKQIWYGVQCYLLSFQ